MKLRGKTAIITGGSRGIGRAVAELFLKEGANVMIAARSAEELAAAKAALSALPGAAGRVEALVTDVSRKDDARRLVKAATDRFRGLDILVNAAGIYGAIGPASAVDFDKWKKTFEVNLFGTFNMTQEALPIFMNNGAGKIINFSGGGDGPLPNFSAYSASKAAVVRLTETLAEEVKERGVTVNAIAPGPVNTQILEDALDAGEALVGKELYAKMQKQKEDGGVSPGKAAELCVFLASDASDGLSGRLVSAVWDDWRSWDAGKIKEIMGSDKLKLRRTPLK